MKDKQEKKNTENKLDNIEDLIKENEELKKQKEMLDQMVLEFTETQDHLVKATWREREMKQQLNAAMEDLEKSKQLIENQNMKITDSINYARKIQRSIVPDINMIKKEFPDSFIFYKPKDVVSGDFPWLYPKGDFVYIAAVDCTGHGVPGAMMSLIGHFLLNEINSHREILAPSVVLDKLDEHVRTTLQQDVFEDAARDGMDIALCRIHTKTNELEFSAAHRPLFVVNKNGELNEFKGDKKDIGGPSRLKRKGDQKFANHKIQLNKGDTIYFFSDGLPDQFGGPEKLKFSPAKIRSIVTDNYKLSMDKMEKKFEDEFMGWMGDMKQMDDVLLISLRF